jgi:hypothetical protein
MFLDKRLVGISLLVGSILTRLLLILYSNTSLACLLRASNDVHCSRRGVMISVSYISCCPSLYHFKAMPVILLIRIPYSTCVFHRRSFYCLVFVLFYSWITDVNVSLEEAQCAVCSFAYICNVDIPSQIWWYCYPRSFADVTCSICSLS